MSKIIFVFVLCGSAQVVGMDDPGEMDMHSGRSMRMHREGHEDEIAFIRSSNKPLTTATAVGNCHWCMQKAIRLHRDKDSSLFGWVWNCCRKKSNIHEDVREAVWNAAAHSEKIHQLIVLLNHFENACEVTKAARSLLFHAVAHMNLPAAHTLLARGACVDQPATGHCAYMNHTPLMVAVHVTSDKTIKARIAMVNLLLKHGANVNSWHIDSPLLLAKDTEIASILIGHDAFIDDCDSNGCSIFDADYMRFADHKDPQTKALLKKILIEGSFRAHMNGMADDDCRVVKAPQRLVEHEFVLWQLLEQFKKATIPRAVQALILSYLPFSKNMCSVSVLSHIGDQLTQKHADFAVEYVSQAVLKRALQNISVGHKSIFAKRLADALTNRRLKALVPLMNKQMKAQWGSVAGFVWMCNHDYLVHSRPTVGASPGLENDIQSHYLKKLLGTEK
jgi:hypothetical protein